MIAETKENPFLIGWYGSTDLNSRMNEELETCLVRSGRDRGVGRWTWCCPSCTAQREAAAGPAETQH